MIILVGVTINFVTSGGIIDKAHTASTQMQIEADREMLLADATVAMGTDGKLDKQLFSTLATADEFYVPDTDFPITVSSKSGNEFTITEDGEIISAGERDQAAELELLRKYFVGKSIYDVLDLEASPEDDELHFKDGTEEEETQDIHGVDLQIIEDSNSDNESTVVRDGVTYRVIKGYVKYKGTTYVVQMELEEGKEMGEDVVTSVQRYVSPNNSGGSGSEPSTEPGGEDPIDPENPEDNSSLASFTLNGINTSAKNYVSQEYQTKKTNSEIDSNMTLDEYYYQNFLSNNLQIAPMDETKEFSLLMLPSEVFWGAVGKTFMGQYGINMNNMELVNSNNTIKSSSKTEFTEWYQGASNTSNNVISIMDMGDYGVYLLLAKNTNGVLSANVSKDGNDSNGNPSASILDWDTFLDTYGNIEFYFSDSDIKTETVAASVNIWNTTKTNNDTYAEKGGTYTNTFTPQSGYKLPATINVSMGGTTLNENQYTWNSTTGELSIPNVTGSISISGSASQIQNYSVNVYASNGVYAGTYPSSVTEGSSLKIDFYTESQDYLLPETIQVSMNWTTLNSDQYTWNSETGTLTIPNVTGYVSITVQGNNLINNVTLNTSNVTTNGASTVSNGETYSATFTADTHYNLPSTITVSMGGTDLTTNQYTWNSTTGVLSVPNVTNYLDITVIGEQIVRNVSFNLTNVTTNGAVTVGSGNTYQCTINASAHYNRPSTITVSMGGTELNSNQYTWNSSNGQLTIPNVSGDIEITETGEQIVRNVTLNLTNVTSNGVTTVNDGDTYQCTFTPEEHYKLPKYITVRIGTSITGSYTWNSTTGTLSIPSVTGDLTITVTGESLIRNVTLSLSNVTSNGASTVEIGETYTCTFTANAHYSLPGSIIVEMNGKTIDAGLNQYTWNSQTGGLTIPNVTGNIYISVAGESLIRNVTLNLNNVTSNGASTTEIGETYTCTFTANEGFKLPESITVQMNGITLDAGLNQYTYNVQTGSLTITNITGNIEISVDGMPLVFLGKYIQFEGILWRGLYDDETNGFQLVSANTLEADNVHVGYGNNMVDWTDPQVISEANIFSASDGESDDLTNVEKSIYSINHIVENSNKKSEQIVKDLIGDNNYVLDIRCVGSDPLNKNNDTNNMIWNGYNNYPGLDTLPTNDSTYPPYSFYNKIKEVYSSTKDINQMYNLGMITAENSKQYLIPGRIVYSFPEAMAIYHQTAASNGSVSTLGGRIYIGYDVSVTDTTCGIRPVITINPIVKDFATGTGTSSDPIIIH